MTPESPHRVRDSDPMKSAILALAAVLASLVAAGCSSSSRTPAPDGGDAGAAAQGPMLAACDHYYAAQFTRCGGPILPADERRGRRAVPV